MLHSGADRPHTLCISPLGDTFAAIPLHRYARLNSKRGRSPDVRKNPDPDKHSKHGAIRLERYCFVHLLCPTITREDGYTLDPFRKRRAYKGDLDRNGIPKTHLIGNILISVDTRAERLRGVKCSTNGVI